MKNTSLNSNDKNDDDNDNDDDYNNWGIERQSGLTYLNFLRG